MSSKKSRADLYPFLPLILFHSAAKEHYEHCIIHCYFWARQNFQLIALHHLCLVNQGVGNAVNLLMTILICSHSILVTSG